MSPSKPQSAWLVIDREGRPVHMHLGARNVYDTQEAAEHFIAAWPGEGYRAVRIEWQTTLTRVEAAATGR